MIWDGNGYPVKRCCAKCRTPYNCAWSECPCHVSPAFVAGSDSLGAQGHETGSQALVDGFDSERGLDVIFTNTDTRRK
jgi:hypothetical protein